MIPGMPGPLNGQHRRRPRNTTLRNRRSSRAVVLFGTSSTRTTPTGNTSNRPRAMSTSNLTVGAKGSALASEPAGLCGASKGEVGMACLIVAESAIFAIFVVAYLYYLGRDMHGPTPKEVLRLPILNTICLLSSSITITLAVRALTAGFTGQFAGWWLATIALGGYFLLGP